MNNLHERLMAEALFMEEQFTFNKNKSYKAGFDNGYAMGKYRGFVEAADMCAAHESMEANGKRIERDIKKKQVKRKSRK